MGSPQALGGHSPSKRTPPCQWRGPGGIRRPTVRRPCLAEVCRCLASLGSIFPSSVSVQQSLQLPAALTTSLPAGLLHVARFGGDCRLPQLALQSRGHCMEYASVMRCLNRFANCCKLTVALGD